MESTNLTKLHYGQRYSVDSIPPLDSVTLLHELESTVNGSGAIAALSGAQAYSMIDTWGVVHFPGMQSLLLCHGTLPMEYPALTPRVPQMHLFEREFAEELGARPLGHPWLTPVRTLPGSGADDGQGWRWGRIEGPAVHEVSVGPVHAGVIEPGHFRFQCSGERVLHLEVALGYQHRGIAQALLGGPTVRTPHLIETAAGDTSVGHMVAYCQLLEALGGCEVPPRAEQLRAIALELERLANHIGDLGTLSGDVAFQPTAAMCGRLRGDALNMTARLCGNRFGRALVIPGGVRFDVSPEDVDWLLTSVERLEREALAAAGLLLDHAVARSRFEQTGTLDATACTQLGIVGPPARAAGVPQDVRHDLPDGPYAAVRPALVTQQQGDVLARVLQRVDEVRASIDFIQQVLPRLPRGRHATDCDPPAAHSVSATAVEGWRGRICHLAITGDNGRFSRYKIVDPSVFNWAGLAVAMRGQEISDFPVCNKSFNLSYCGHDL